MKRVVNVGYDTVVINIPETESEPNLTEHERIILALDDQIKALAHTEPSLTTINKKLDSIISFFGINSSDI